MAGLAPDARATGGPGADGGRGRRPGRARRNTWRQVTLARLAEGADGPWTLHRLAARPGEVVADPGWIELHLSLSEVDVEVRTAGLDLDPGFLPWLGVVVTVSYD